MPRKKQKPSAIGLKVNDTIDAVVRMAKTLAKGSRNQKEWMAILLCIGDRWGIGKAEATLRTLGVLEIVRDVAFWHAQLRVHLASRQGSQRIQAQRIIKGPSLLVIMRCRSAEHSSALHGLLALMIHPSFGLDGYRVDAHAVPQMLPKCLQPNLPILPNRCVECHAINAVFSAMYTSSSVEVDAFVKSIGADTADGRRKLGLPVEWDVAIHGFKTIIPEVDEGDVLVWNTWHASGGADKSSEGPKLVAFLDMIPQSFLSDDLYLWYEFVSRHAPMDPGAGSSRGSWLNLVHMLMSTTDDFGIDVTTWVKCGRTDLLPLSARRILDIQGYLVVKTPPDLRQLASVSCAGFQSFFQNVSDYSLDLKVASGHNSVAEMFDIHGLAVIGSVMIDPLQPFALTGVARSKNPQGGGSIITKSTGMGAGTTYCNEPGHVQFQTSQFLADLFTTLGGAFYDAPLIPVWERFRLKDKSPWKAGMHVDTTLESLIPHDMLDARRKAGNDAA